MGAAGTHPVWGRQAAWRNRKLLGSRPRAFPVPIDKYGIRIPVKKRRPPPKRRPPFKAFSRKKLSQFRRAKNGIMEQGQAPYCPEYTLVTYHAVGYKVQRTP